jgi:serine/threonine-protein kinase HipA
VGRLAPNPGPTSGQGSIFAYDGPESLQAASAVSMTMPIRLASYNMPRGLHPIFEMNLPEGSLREKLRLAFAKTHDQFEDIDLLSIVGRSQIGRIRYTGMSDSLDESVPFQSVDELLRHRGSDDLYQYLGERFASTSGISGVQPKLLLQDAGALSFATKEQRQSTSIRGATHIVKFWEPKDHPHLAANEFFCLTAAKRANLNLPSFQLSDDASALVIERFDLRADGTYRGFEDFAVLNGRPTSQKYQGSYETAILRRLQEFISPYVNPKASADCFALIVLNAILRNGDAHLKNFGILYDQVDVPESACLAPVYDLVTTTAYIPPDIMALTLGGTKRWPNRKALLNLAAQRSISGAPAILERMGDAVLDTRADVRRFMADRPDFAPIGAAMLTAWEAGLAQTLGITGAAGQD